VFRVAPFCPSKPGDWAARTSRLSRSHHMPKNQVNCMASADGHNTDLLSLQPEDRETYNLHLLAGKDRWMWTFPAVGLTVGVLDFIVSLFHLVIHLCLTRTEKVEKSSLHSRISLKRSCTLKRLAHTRSSVRKSRLSIGH